LAATARRSIARLAGAVLLVLTMSVTAFAARPFAPRPWTDGNQLALNWQEMSPDQRQRALENYQRYNNLPESSRRRMDQSYENWQKLDPTERDRVQQNYQKYRQMTPDQRHDFENKYRRWKGGGQR
jgi:hypothetical protein